MTLNAQGVECKMADPCVKCMHGALHPPLLATYDEERGDYALATESVCMARWASTNQQHGQGHICGLPVFRSAGEFNLCEHHYWRVIDYRYWDKPREELKEKTRALREADKEFAAAVRDSEIHRERVRVERSLVYYIRRTSDGMIKIGTTAGFKNRMATHRKEQGEIQILLTHSGGREKERAVHNELDASRAGRSEWFYPTRQLLNWILSTRQIERHRKTQGLDILPQAAIRKLLAATPADAYCWRAGRLVPRPPAADESAA